MTYYVVAWSYPSGYENRGIHTTPEAAMRQAVALARTATHGRMVIERWLNGLTDDGQVWVSADGVAAPGVGADAFCAALAADLNAAWAADHNPLRASEPVVS
jgi:hypothetical protein